MSGSIVAIGTPAIGATPAVDPNAPVPNITANHAERLEKIVGLNIKRSQQKMLFYLTTLNLAWFLTETAPVIVDGQVDAQSVNVVDAWKHS